MSTTEVGPPSNLLVGPHNAMLLLSRPWTQADEAEARRTIRGLVDLVEAMERHGSQQEREIIRLRAVQVTRYRPVIRTDHASPAAPEGFTYAAMVAAEDGGWVPYGGTLKATE